MIKRKTFQEWIVSKSHVLGFVTIKSILEAYEKPTVDQLGAVMRPDKAKTAGDEPWKMGVDALLAVKRVDTERVAIAKFVLEPEVAYKWMPASDIQYVAADEEPTTEATNPKKTKKPKAEPAPTPVTPIQPTSQHPKWTCDESKGQWKWHVPPEGQHNGDPVPPQTARSIERARDQIQYFDEPVPDTYWVYYEKGQPQYRIDPLRGVRANIGGEEIPFSIDKLEQLKQDPINRNYKSDTVAVPVGLPGGPKESPFHKERSYITNLLHGKITEKEKMKLCFSIVQKWLNGKISDKKLQTLLKPDELERFGIPPQIPQVEKPRAALKEKVTKTLNALDVQSEERPLPRGELEAMPPHARWRTHSYVDAPTDVSPIPKRSEEGLDLFYCPMCLAANLKKAQKRQDLAPEQQMQLAKQNSEVRLMGDAVDESGQPTEYAMPNDHTTPPKQQATCGHEWWYEAQFKEPRYAQWGLRQDGRKRLAQLRASGLVANPVPEVTRIPKTVEPIDRTDRTMGDMGDKFDRISREASPMDSSLNAMVGRDGNIIQRRVKGGGDSE